MRTYIQNIDGKYYAYAADPAINQVYSIGADQKQAERAGAFFYCAKWTDAGVKYVASPSPSRQAAIAKAKRGGKYCGEI